MCGRFTSLLSPELLAIIFEIFPPPPAVEPRYNIAPTQQVWVVRSDGEHNRFDHMKWGLIPSWAKDQKIGSNLINARSETVAEKPAFRHAIKYNRCIVPASGFYDWVRHVSRMHDCPAAHPAGPAVPSAVPYEVGRRGNKSSKSPLTM